MSLKVFSEQAGSGPPVVLLHGFPMNHLVWKDVVPAIAMSYTVFTPDLPGLGNSPLPPGEFALEAVGGYMNDWAEENGITGAVLVGHSLGGYVALEMVRQQPHRYAGLVLFHSTAYADTAEKKESRTRVLNFIGEHGVLAFTSGFIPPLFADPKHPSISFVKGITMKAGEEAVRGYTIAMRERPDNTSVLRNYDGGILLIGGEQDQGISVSALEDQVKMTRYGKLEILSGAAHMGMFERSEIALAALKDFLKKILPKAG